MKRVWPATLFGRNALLLVLLVALGQLTGMYLLRELVLVPRAEHMAEGLARNIDAIRAGISGLPVEARQGFVDRFNAQACFACADREHPRLSPELTRLDHRLLDVLSRRIARQDSEVSWLRDAGGSLALHITIEGRTYRLMLVGVLPPSETNGVWLAASAGAGLLALLGALLIQRRLNRPLSQVVAAAEQLSSGGMPQPLPESGPSETAALSRSVNRMVQSLEHSARERGLMLAGISHDLRTPLAKLRLGVEILAPQADPAIYASMERSIAEMDGIVGQFLDFARADGADEAMERVSLDDIAAEAVAACIDHGRTVDFQRSGLPALPVQPTLLLRAVTNLLENAWRHGRPPVSIATGAEGSCAWLEVQDHGPGIAPAETERLKQPFRMAAPGRRQGAGLGLAIVDRAARAHGGRLELGPAQGGGLRARLWIASNPQDLTSGPARR